jgi:hypothetical protein
MSSKKITATAVFSFSEKMTEHLPGRLPLAPEEQAMPATTSSIFSGLRPALLMASSAVIAPRSTALISLKMPPKSPTGFLPRLQ